MRHAVLVAAGGAPWEADLVAALDRDGSTVRVARRCVDVVELLAVAASGQGQVALIAADLRRLDADAVDRLLASGVVPVAMVARGSATGSATDTNRVRAMGIDHVVPDDAPVPVVITVLTAAVGERAGDPGAAAVTGRAFGDPAATLDRPAATLDRGWADPGSADPIPPGAGPPLPDDAPPRSGSVVAVWGPTGAPGRTTVAVGLADELARLGIGTLLVDGDCYGGTVAAGLGLLDESPGLAAACRRAGSTRLDATALASLCWQLRAGLRVLTGIPLASRWPELRPAAVGATLTAARSLADFVIVDCGFCLETDEELSFDSLAPRRNGATLAMLDAADVVLVVGSADPIGVQRLIRALAELSDAEITAPTWVVLNRVRRGAVPGSPEDELRTTLDRLAGRTPAALLPSDQPALDAALAVGRTLGEHRPGSPLRAALIELAAAVGGVEVASRSRPGARGGHRRRARRFTFW